MINGTHTWVFLMATLQTWMWALTQHSLVEQAKFRIPGQIWDPNPKNNFIFCTKCTNYAALPFSLMDKHDYLALCGMIQLQQQHLTQALNFKHIIDLNGTKWISAHFSLNVLINPLLLSREFHQWSRVAGKKL